MIFNDHSNLLGQHSFLSASKYHWINYSDAKLDAMFLSNMAAARGTRFHALADELIKMGVKLPKSEKTLNMYVNDAIGFKMRSEQVLWYSENAFCTVDTIQFRHNKLRVHDLKMGVTPTSEHQLEVGVAYFCLEYQVKPHNIEIEMRIYQNDERRIYDADPDVIAHIMDRIKTFDRRIKELRKEAMS
jgi:hypothetical protein